jgi:RHS repeat-associated protein
MSWFKPLLLAVKIINTSGGGTLEPLMQRRYHPGTETWYNYYYVQDGLGHTRLVLDANGNAVNRYAYDAWGNLIDYEEAVPNPFTWNGAYGYEYIPLTGLYHVGAREYDPRTGRWLQRDPIEASSGDPHFWRYCKSNPLNFADPTGAVPEWVHAGLDMLGLIPVIGDVADGINGLAYLSEGDAFNAGISFVGMVPGVGDMAKAGRLGKRAQKWAAKHWDDPGTVLYASSKSGRAARPFLVGPYNELRDCASGTGMPAHHVPQAHPAQQSIPGYDRNDAPAILLPDSRRHLQMTTMKGTYAEDSRELIAWSLRQLREAWPEMPRKDFLRLVKLISKKYPNLPRLGR